MNTGQILVILSCLVASACALQCYVCQSQPNNKDKCIKTATQCREEETTCMSRVYWGQPPFWLPRALRMFRISKHCADDTKCETERHALGVNYRCKRDWFEDWECVECCKGDMCNYYVTLGSSRPSTSMILTLSCVATILSLFWIQER